MESEENLKELSFGMLDDALDGRLDAGEAARMLSEICGDRANGLLRSMGFSSAMREAGRTAGLDDLLEKLAGNKWMVAAAVAFLVATGELFSYSVKSGDTLSSIAKRCGCGWQRLVELNPQIINPDRIRPGMRIAVPERPAAEPAGKPAVEEYSVRSGDTLWTLARKCGITLEALMEMNPGAGDSLKVGQTLKVPAGSAGKLADSAGRQEAAPAADPKTDFLARVIYSETSTKCTDEEVRLVCSVIMNRVGNKAFGGGADAYDVVSRRNAFSCVNDSGNSNWQDYRRDLNSATERDYGYAEDMMSGGSGMDVEPGVVYYCNKSLAERYAAPGQKYGYPPGWESNKWRPVLVKATEHFCFYKIVDKSKAEKEPSA